MQQSAYFSFHDLLCTWNEDLHGWLGGFLATVMEWRKPPSVHHSWDSHGILASAFWYCYCLLSAFSHGHVTELVLVSVILMAWERTQCLTQLLRCIYASL